MRTTTPIAAGSHPYWIEPPVLSATYAKRACGCEVVGNGTLPHPLDVKFCKVHAVAPALLQAVTELLDAHDACDTVEYRGAPAGTHRRRDNAFKAVRSAIAKTKGKP